MFFSQERNFYPSIKYVKDVIPGNFDIETRIYK